MSARPATSCYASPCGRVTLYLGDCRDIAPTLELASGDLILADPPYGMGKEKDGVMNDNLYGAKLDAFLLECWKACRPSLKDSGSAYIWGNSADLWRLWYVGGLKDLERLTFRNQIVWDKPPSASPCGSPIGSEMMRSYPHGYETALFFMLGEQGFKNNADNYWDGWEPIRLYLETEMNKCGGSKKWKEALGNKMGSHYFTKSQWSFPTKEAYEKLQAFSQGNAFKREHDAFKREHDDLKREHDDLKREFYANRTFFDNTHQGMTDVWDYPRVTGLERHGHATPKPVAMMGRCVLTSCPPGGIVLDPFMGTAPTGIACIRTGRRFIGIEKDPTHYATALERIKNELAQGDLFLEHKEELNK